MKDLIIIGGGISGLYTLYKIVKNKKNSKRKYNISLYEKSDYFGGRIYTFFPQKEVKGNFTKNIKFEAGAARFCKEKHLIFYKLICELFSKNELKKYLNLGGAEIKFIPSSNNYNENLIKKSPYYFINKVIQKSKRFSYNTLIKYTFIQFIKKYKLLKNEEINYLNDAFGYSGEITSMNTYNAIHMFKTDLNKKYTYYSLSCGLSEIIKRMIKYINKNKGKHNIKILKNIEIEEINKNSDNTFDCLIKNNKRKESKIIKTEKIICAIQKSALLKFPIFSSIKKELNSVEAKALCRIYMIFDKNNIWFEKYGKITTNNINRYMIPLNKKAGTIMISYTDSNYAIALNNYYKKHGLKKLESLILKNWERVLKISIPKPIYTKVCYWNEGIAMWKANANSKIIYKKLLNPMENIYIVGENYSLNQAWIEGGLQSVENIFKLNNI